VQERKKPNLSPEEGSSNRSFSKHSDWLIRKIKRLLATLKEFRRNIGIRRPF